jgi:hydroxymethylpyrimidine pyrophosphatase-like HAD family hydrolase
MIVTDLDDILLRSHKSISDYTLGVLAKCRAKGIKTIDGVKAVAKHIGGSNDNDGVAKWLEEHITMQREPPPKARIF